MNKNITKVCEFCKMNQRKEFRPIFILLLYEKVTTFLLMPTTF